MKSDKNQNKNIKHRRGYSTYHPWVCLRCGIIFQSVSLAPTLDNLCPSCRRLHQKKKAMYRHRIKVISEGYTPESHKIRGRKAYYTRLANLYFSDSERYDRLIENLREKHPGRVAQVTRRINVIREREM